MKKVCLLLALLGCLFQARAALENALTLPYLSCPQALSLHYVISEPASGPIVGDIFFLHGLGDSAENHAPLFKVWTSGGFRVIAVDLPSHGKTTGASLNWTTFSGLTQYLPQFLNQPKVRPDQNRPLIVTGWSTGGLLAVRLLQKNAFRDFNRKPDGLILFAPGISVKMLPGEWGMITEPTLTRNPNPPHPMPISPTSPFSYPLFALRLKVNSWLAQLGELPKDLPTLVFLAGDDKYIHTESTRRWFERQIERGGSVWGYEFDSAFHELDNELDEVATRVHFAASLFARSLVSGETQTLFGTPKINFLEPQP